MPLFDKVQTDISSFDWSDINNPKQNEQTTPQGDSIFRGNLPDLETTGIRKKLEDREKDIDAQYEKFNGNKGLRTGNLGFDEPFIVKDVGDRYLSAEVDDGIFRGGALLNVVRTLEDGVRFAKWTLTPRGIVWNLKQFLLQAQNARAANRIFNPLGPIGSIAPMVHLPRHTDGTFTDFEEPPKYDPLAAKKEPEEPTTEFQRLVERGQKFLGTQTGNNLLEIHNDRIVNNKERIGNPHPLGAIGLNNTEFIDPENVTRSTQLTNAQKDSFNIQDVDEKEMIAGEGMITNYEGPKQGGIFTSLFGGDETDGLPGLRDYNSRKKFGQSNIILNSKGSDTSAEVHAALFLDEPDSIVGTDNVNYPTQLATNVSMNKFGQVLEEKENADDYNLGRGLVKTGDGKLYAVGVSNQLQVPYGGEFGKLTASIPDLPKDFVKFRIRDAVNGKWLIFPAHLGAIADSVTPTYNTERYIGRPDAVHVYSGTDRTVTLDFKVAAFTKQEIPIIQEKMNYLVGLAYPTFKKVLSTDDETRPVAPYVYLTIGDMFNNTPGYFSQIDINVEENATWEIDEGFQIPQFFSVNLTFVHIGKVLPTTTSKHYDVPWLKDNGAPSTTFGELPENSIMPDRQAFGDLPNWAEEL